MKYEVFKFGFVTKDVVFVRIIGADDIKNYFCKCYNCVLLSVYQVLICSRK